MEYTELNKPINQIDANNSFSRAVSARKVRKFVKRAAMKNGASGVSGKPSKHVATKNTKKV